MKPLRYFQLEALKMFPSWPCRFLALCSFLLLSALAIAQAISKADLVALKRAGVDDSIVIRKIQSDGIAFDVSAQNILELKNAGVSNSVLDALVAASTKPSENTALYKQLYGSGEYGQLADHLRSALAKEPQDAKLRTLLILTLLRLNDRPQADAEFLKLQQANSGEKSPYLTRIQKLFKDLDSQDAARGLLTNALQNFQVKEAKAQIDNLSASDEQKTLLRAYLSAYQGAFQEASDTLSSVHPTSTASQQRIRTALERLQQAKLNYTKLRSDIDAHLYSGWSPSTPCVGILEDAPKGWHVGQVSPMPKSFLQEYFQSVANLYRLGPLNEDVLDLMFHAVFLTAQYRTVEELGDKILAAKGTIRIPAFGRDQYFNIIIDRTKQRVYTQPDTAHTFSVRNDVVPRPFAASVRHNEKTSSWSEPVEPFDRGFGDIVAVHQKLHLSRMGMSNISHSWALKFDPKGVAPNYLLMSELFCLYGEPELRTATNNLGQFVVHVAGHNVRSELVDPSARSGGGLGSALTNVMLVGVATAVTGASQGTEAASQAMTNSISGIQTYNQEMNVREVP